MLVLGEICDLSELRVPSAQGWDCLWFGILTYGAR